MKKAKRATGELGSGSGTEIFCGEYFRVVLWCYSNAGPVTKIESQTSPFFEITLLGKHDITSDNACVEQLRPSEILKIFKHFREQGFIEGRHHKFRTPFETARCGLRAALPGRRRRPIDEERFPQAGAKNIPMPLRRHLRPLSSAGLF